jgi:hypothetical protein
MKKRFDRRNCNYGDLIVPNWTALYPKRTIDQAISLMSGSFLLNTVRGGQDRRKPAVPRTNLIGLELAPRTNADKIGALPSKPTRLEIEVFYLFIIIISK